jgi:isopentenyldiphosphate isomerase
MLPSTVKEMPWTSDFQADHAQKTVRLKPVDPAKSLTAALKDLTDKAIEEDTFRIIHQEHSEFYSILGVEGLTIERYFTPLFGTISRGAHLTVFTRVGPSKELRIWVPRRSYSCFTYPGCLDTTVAGGVPAGECPLGCIIREADEEASLPEALVRRCAVACGALTYMQETAAGDGGEHGLVAPDILYVYELEVEEDIKCRPQDDEVQDFNLMSVEEVQQALANGEFKTNSAVVMLDFFIRHGIINEGNEKHYTELLMRMHRRLPFPTSSD